MTQIFRPLTCFLALALLAGLSCEARALVNHKNSQNAKKAEAATGKRHQRKAVRDKGKHAGRDAAKRQESTPAAKADPETTEATPLTGDLAEVRNAIDLEREGKIGEATAAEKTIRDPAAQKLVEWYILRHPESTADFSRYAAFIADNPDWPSVALMRRRAEARLWQERSDPKTVHEFTHDRPPSAKGRLALSRALLAEGDRNGAVQQIREAWRSEELSERAETEAFEAFHDLLTPEDHRAHGQAYWRPGFFRRDAGGASSRRRRGCDREGLCRGGGE